MYAISNNSTQMSKDDFTFRIENCEPSEFAKDVARRELRETPENVENGLRQLRELLREEPNLYCPIDNDIWLLSFLRPAHFYPEEARNMVRNYFNFRTQYPELCQDLSLETMQEFLKGCNVSMLPQRDQCGRRICVTLSGKYWNAGKDSKDVFLKSFILQSEFVRTESDTQICGITTILDVSGLTLRQALKIKPAFAKRMVEFTQNGMCIRFKGIHIFNQSKIFDMIFALAKPFLREKYRERIFFHGNDVTSLHRHISPECLPECYGGTLKMTPPYSPEIYEVLAKYKKDYDITRTYGYIQ